MNLKPALTRILRRHLLLGLMIATEIAFIVLAMRFVVPACRRIVSYVDVDGHGYYATTPWVSTFMGLLHIAAYNVTLFVLVAAVLWAGFRRFSPGRARPELRLSVLATLALGLFAVAAVLSGLMILPTAHAADRLNARDPAPVIAQRLATLDRLIGPIQLALARSDLPTADDLAHTAMGAANDLANTGDAAPTILASTDPARVAALRSELATMASSMRQAWFAARRRQADQVQPPLQQFRAAYARVKIATTRPAS